MQEQEPNMQTPYRKALFQPGIQAGTLITTESPSCHVNVLYVFFIYLYSYIFIYIFSIYLPRTYTYILFQDL